MAAARIETRKAPAFGEWLSGVCDRYDISKRDLVLLFIRGGGDASDQAVGDWLKGRYEPNARKMGLLLEVLDQAIPGFDVYESWVNYMRGREWLPKQPSRRGRGHSEVHSFRQGDGVATTYINQTKGPDLRKQVSKPNDKSRKPPSAVHPSRPSEEGRAA